MSANGAVHPRDSVGGLMTVAAWRWVGLSALVLFSAFDEGRCPNLLRWTFKVCAKVAPVVENQPRFFEGNILRPKHGVWRRR